MNILLVTFILSNIEMTCNSVLESKCGYSFKNCVQVKEKTTPKDFSCVKKVFILKDANNSDLYIKINNDK